MQTESIDIMSSLAIPVTRSNRSKLVAYQPPEYTGSMIASERALDGPMPPHHHNHHAYPARRDARFVHACLPSTVRSVATTTTLNAPSHVQLEHEDKHDLQQRNVYIYGLPDYFRSSTFRVMCEVYGRIESCKLAMNGESATMCKGYGFVLYANVKSALACIAALQGKFIGSKQLQARRADFSAVPQPISRFVYPSTGAEMCVMSTQLHPSLIISSNDHHIHNRGNNPTNNVAQSAAIPTSCACALLNSTMTAPATATQYVSSAPAQNVTNEANSTMTFVPVRVETQQFSRQPNNYDLPRTNSSNISNNHRNDMTTMPAAAATATCNLSTTHHPVSVLFNTLEPLVPQQSVVPHCFSTSSVPCTLCQTSPYVNNSWAKCEESQRLSYTNIAAATPMMGSPSTPTCLLHTVATANSNSSVSSTNSARPPSRASMRRSGQLSSESRCHSECKNESPQMSIYSGGDQSTASAIMSSIDPSLTTATGTPPCMNYIVGPCDSECNLLQINWSPLFL